MEDAGQEQQGGIAISAAPMRTGDNVRISIDSNSEDETGPCLSEAGAIASQLLEDEQVRNGNINRQVTGVWSLTATTAFVNGTSNPQIENGVVHHLRVGDTLSIELTVDRRLRLQRHSDNFSSTFVFPEPIVTDDVHFFIRLRNGVAVSLVDVAAPAA
ncbi:uncharacterized protein LOC135819631 [Sycon ciliatum]|uniref:uncharacterized protein LOC135819631 n=1 Tax=Sycon ciliatum TaxID=27933 RepID=UPI0020AC3385|eukprot:scpid93330/ scgid15070/ 